MPIGKFKAMWQCKWCCLCHVVAQFATDASGASWWLNFQPVHVAPPGGLSLLRLEKERSWLEARLPIYIIIVKMQHNIRRHIRHRMELFTPLIFQYRQNNLTNIINCQDFLLSNTHGVQNQKVQLPCVNKQNDS